MRLYLKTDAEPAFEMPCLYDWRSPEMGIVSGRLGFLARFPGWLALSDFVVAVELCNDDFGIQFSDRMRKEETVCKPTHK